MAIYYIDVDDEITSAAARIRDSGDVRIALVIQGGSRWRRRGSTSPPRREARHRGRQLSIIAADASVRSLARRPSCPSLPALPTTRRPRMPSRPRQGGGSGRVSDALDEPAGTVERAARGRPESRVWPARGGPSGRASRRRNPSAVWLRCDSLAAVGIVAVLLVGGVGAFLLLPSASIVLTLKEEPVGPLNLTIKVDPAMALQRFDADGSGVARDFAVQASDTFGATAKRRGDDRTGTVTFTSGNTGLVVQIPAGPRSRPPPRLRSRRLPRSRCRRRLSPAVPLSHLQPPTWRSRP